MELGWGQVFECVAAVAVQTSETRDGVDSTRNAAAMDEDDEIDGFSDQMAGTVTTLSWISCSRR
jgi:hypothetical protein